MTSRTWKNEWFNAPALACVPGILAMRGDRMPPCAVKPLNIRLGAMLACAQPRADNSGTWITQKMLDVYCQLHEMGIAHSIECWHNKELVGGMYGLVLGDIFFGESMFSKQPDASKAAMHYLCTIVKPYLIDAQVYSKHLETLGAEEIDRHDFSCIVNSRLKHALNI